MRDLTEFVKWSSYIAGASVTKTAELLCFSRATLSRTMPEFEKRGKISSNRNNSGRTSKLTERGRLASRRKNRTTAAKVTTKVNQNLNSPVSTRTVRRELNKVGYHWMNRHHEISAFHY